MSNPVPERLTNFRVYLEGNNLAGIATIDLPDIEAMTDTVTGAGIAGEVDSPIVGHFGSMAATLTFRTITEDGVNLNAQRSHAIEARGAMQVYDAANGTYSQTAVRVAMRGIPKRNGLGTLEVGSTTDSEVELELTYMKIYINNVERLELDKYNFRYVVDGVDYLAEVREALGQ